MKTGFFYFYYQDTVILNLFQDLLLKSFLYRN